MYTLGLFVKHPVPGQVKTRLAGALGDDAATRLYVAFVADILARFRSFPGRRSLGFTPDEPAARAAFDALGRGAYQLWAQPSSDLGSRMFAFFRDHLRNPGDRAVLIGSDSPTLPFHFVDKAFQSLRDHDLVLGPAADGGYYLIGMTAPAKNVFDGIPWSEPTVLLKTAERISELKLRCALLPLWYDVDSHADVYLLRGHLAAMAASGEGLDCPATWEVLQGLPGDLDQGTRRPSVGNPSSHSAKGHSP
jgi:hypothetical protein